MGGLIFAILIAYALSHLFTILPLWKWMGCGFITVIAGTYGDLVETGSVKALSAAIGRALDTAGPDPGILRARARDFDLAVFRAAWEAYIRDLSDTQAR